MSTYRIQGGTHLGIVSCYGEKTFKAKSVKDLIEKVRANRKLGDIPVVPHKTQRDTIIYQFMEGEAVAFEFRIMEKTK